MVITFWSYSNRSIVKNSKIQNIKNFSDFVVNFDKKLIQLDQNDINIISSLNCGAKGATCMLRYCIHDD